MTSVLDIRQVYLEYGSKIALNRISFSVNEAEFFIVIGPNGSGKTSLVKVISGIIPPRSGDIMLLGCPMRQFSRRMLARNIAVVSQAIPDDIPFTVAETVLLGRSPSLGLLEMESRRDVEIAEQAMAFTRVTHLAKRRMHHLSGGERQRVLIARAICQQPRILVLDEPTASLDLAHQIQVMDLMEQLRRTQDVTIVMVSHDLNLSAMYADRMLLMKDGNRVELGRPSDVMTSELLERIYECALLVDENPFTRTPRVIQSPRQWGHLSS